MSIKSCYIAGPMRGYPAYNFPAFDEARDALVKAGWEVISPADLDRQTGWDPEGKCIVPPPTLDDCIERDVAAVLRTDAIVCLPNWDKSIGARAEVALATWAGHPVLLYPSMESVTDEDILDEAKRLTSGDRQNAYGPPDQDFRRIATMWGAIKGVEFEPREVALFMIAVKLSRETHQKKRDNWVDIAGYARCGFKCGV